MTHVLGGSGPTARAGSVDAVVIGGGFFGCRIASHLRVFLPRVMLVDQEDDLLQRASYNNQARVHQGYHYPRSLLTAMRSRVNFDRFIADYPDCIDASFDKFYAVGRVFSHVTARQFRLFCERIGAPIEPAPADVRHLFDPTLVEDVFQVKEFAFDAVKLKAHARRDLDQAGVDLRLGTRALRVQSLDGDCLAVDLIGRGGRAETVVAGKVFNCTYSAINHLLDASGLPIIPLKHERAEMALVEPPEPLQGAGVTMMCGPFFSIMPFPPRDLHTLSHVRYTPHVSWFDGASGPVRSQPPPLPDGTSHHENMIRDAARFMPCLADCRYRGSLYEVKTVLPASEGDDSRPILFRWNHGITNLVCVMGGKIDNVYDVIQEIDEMHAQGRI